MRTELIKTINRPIKKIFVIKEDDFDGFSKILKEISDEVDQICNLIIPLDDFFYLDSTREFVRRFDADILFNLTDESDEIFEERFEIKSVKPDSDVWKIGRFGTRLMNFTTPPTVAGRFGASIPTSMFAAENIENTAWSIFYCANFGLVEDFSKLHLSASIFSEITVNPISKIGKLSDVIFDHDQKFFHLTTHIGFGEGGGTSIYERNHNPLNYFRKDKWIFVGSYRNFSALCYFWNTRSINCFSKLIWVPSEILAELKDEISDDTQLNFVVIREDDRLLVSEIFKQSEVVLATEYYFSGSVSRWKCFDHTQVITISGNSCFIQHPAEKSFSDIGFSGPFVIEVIGIKECVYPLRAKSWDLYKPRKGHWELFQERFIRTSLRGVAAYSLDFSIDNKPIGVEFPLHNFQSTMNYLFSCKGMELKETAKTRLLDQLVNLIGGLEGAKEICQKHVFDIIISLAPTLRTEKALRDLFPDSSLEVLEVRLTEFASAVENGKIEASVAFLSADDFHSKLRHANRNQDKMSSFVTLQNLYDKRIFLRGKSFDCPECASKVWLPLERLSSGNYCPECGNIVNIPVHINGSSEKDQYRLNQLVARAVDQGQISTLLLLNILQKQQFRLFDFVSNLEILREGTAFSDADILFRIGRRIGIAECKSSRNFSEAQIDSLFEITSSLKLDIAILSCLLESNSIELRKSVEYIKAKNFAIPVLIFSKDALFSEEEIKLYSYFELHGDDFLKGPIVVK